MKLLHVIPAVADRYGGPSQLVLEMCAVLADHPQATRVDLVTTDADGDSTLGVEIGQWTDYRGQRTLFFHRLASEAFKFSPGLARWLGQHVRDYDLVHIHAVFSHACLAAARACRRAGIPYLVRPLGTLDPWSMAQKPLRKRLFMQLGVRRMLEQAAALHFTSEAERDRTCRSLGLARGRVVPNGIHTARYDEHTGAATDPDESSGRTVLYLGRIAPKKNLEALIDAFVAAGGSGDRLQIAGDGDPGYVSALKARASAAAGGDRIHFTGWVEADPKLELLGQADLFVLPSHNENYAISLVEAMAAATAVICSDRVALHGDVSDSGGGWVWRDGEDLSRLLGEALVAPDLGQRGRRARQWVASHYDWEVVGDQMLGLYRQILGSAPGGEAGADHA